MIRVVLAEDSDTCRALLCAVLERDRYVAIPVVTERPRVAFEGKRRPRGRVPGRLRLALLLGGSLLLAGLGLLEGRQPVGAGRFLGRCVGHRSLMRSECNGLDRK